MLAAVSARETIIVYHAIGPSPPGAEHDALYVDVEELERQLRFLARNRRVVGLEQLLAGHGESGRPRVAITFDDGFQSVLTEALPLLERYGFPSTVFLTTRWLGDGGEPAIGPSSLEELMSVEDVVELDRRGVELGSHGHTHADVGQLSARSIEADLRESANRLSELVGKRPRFVAWPYGRTSGAGIEAAEAAGFQAGFTTDVPSAGRYAITRVPIYHADGRLLFAFKTSGRYVAVRRHTIVRSAYSALEPLVTRVRR